MSRRVGDRVDESAVEERALSQSRIARHPWRSLALLGLISLALHSVAILILEAPRRPPSLGKPVGTTPAVKLKVITTPAKQVERKAPKDVAARPTRRSAASAAAPAAGDARPRPSRPQTYTDLLPSGAWHGERVDQEGAAPVGSDVGVTPPSRAAIDELSSRLDIPLFSRTKGSGARAVAKLHRQADGSLMLDYLDGDPLLRACLYTMLIMPDNQLILDRLMRSEGQDEFLLTFVHHESLAINLSRYQDDFRLAAGRLTIQRTTFQPMPQAGMAIDDAHARRARARDRGALEKLKDTPAFHSPLRSRPLN